MRAVLKAQINKTVSMMRAASRRWCGPDFIVRCM